MQHLFEDNDVNFFRVVNMLNAFRNVHNVIVTNKDELPAYLAMCFGFYPFILKMKIKDATKLKTAVMGAEKEFAYLRDGSVGKAPKKSALLEASRDHTNYTDFDGFERLDDIISNNFSRSNALYTHSQKIVSTNSSFSFCVFPESSSECVHSGTVYNGIKSPIVTGYLNSSNFDKYADYYLNVKILSVRFSIDGETASFYDIIFNPKNRFEELNAILTQCMSDDARARYMVALRKHNIVQDKQFNRSFNSETTLKTLFYPVKVDGSQKYVAVTPIYPISFTAMMGDWIARGNGDNGYIRKFFKFGGSQSQNAGTYLSSRKGALAFFDARPPRHSDSSRFAYLVEKEGDNHKLTFSLSKDNYGRLMMYLQKIESQFILDNLLEDIINSLEEKYAEVDVDFYLTRLMRNEYKYLSDARPDIEKLTEEILRIFAQESKMDVRHLSDKVNKSILSLYFLGE